MPPHNPTPSIHELRAAVVAIIRQTHPAAPWCLLTVPVVTPDGRASEDRFTIPIVNPEPDLETAVVTVLSVFRPDVWVKSRSIISELKPFGDWSDEHVKEVLAEMAGKGDRGLLESRLGPNGGYRLRSAKDD